MENKEERLQKYLARSGIASRRKAEEYILQGRVKVNGTIEMQLGTKVLEGRDTIEVDGKKIKPSTQMVYLLLNKPIGYVTTSQDQFKRETVLDLLKGVKEKVVPVGRLDMYTSGALLLSNDGDFVYYITHPKNEITKTYQVTIKGIILPEEVEQLKKGVEIENLGEMWKTSPAKVKILHIDEEKQISRIEITIHEGKNREVRKMCEAIGKKVVALHRSKIGDLIVKDIPLGKWRSLTKQEIESLGYKMKSL